jgi:hypothetical protein
MTNTPSSASTLKLIRCGIDDRGRALGLHSGDVLLAVDGKPWNGSAQAFRARLAQGKKPAALSFLRGDCVLTVLSDSGDLGRWESVPLPTTQAPAIGHVEQLCNWEVMAHPDGTHDLFPRRPSVLALLAPPLWMAQARLFSLLTTLFAALALALPGGFLLVAGVWIAAGLHLWRNGVNHLQQDRQQAGYRTRGVVAARNETEARNAWIAISPETRFRFDSRRAPASLTAPATAS